MIKRHRADAPWLAQPLESVIQRPGREARVTLAAALRWLARRLLKAARQLAVQGSLVRTQPQPAELEFYAEAGAPEGALYINGELVGHLDGVTRL